MSYPSTEQSHGFAVRRAHRAFDRLLHSLLLPHKLKTGYWYYLRVLWVQDHLSQKQLSVMNGVTENTTTAVIASMQRDGLVTRKRDPKDGRSMIVSLTPTALALQDAILPYASQVNSIASNGIDVSELETCLRVLKLMSANLEQALTSVGDPA
jgi:MarR family transcriptional regulator, organic hydroperoxide resistance regulator